jgi:hypothetical protein
VEGTSAFGFCCCKLSSVAMSESRRSLQPSHWRILNTYNLKNFADFLWHCLRNSVNIPIGLRQWE